MYGEQRKEKEKRSVDERVRRRFLAKNNWVSRAEKKNGAGKS